MKQNYRSTPMQPPQHALPRPAEAPAARERHAAPAARPPAPLSHPEPDARPPEAKPRRHPAEIAAPVRRDNHAPAITVRRAAVLLCGCIVLLLAAACTADDDFAPTPGGNSTATPAAALTITVTDGAYAPAATAPDDDATPGTAPDNAVPATPGTRAAERGYATEFTAGDKVGLYIVQLSDASNPASGRYPIRANLCLTYDGTAWTLPPGTELTHRPPGGSELLYYAYYPYRDDSYMSGKVPGADNSAWNDLGEHPNEAGTFFEKLIEQWQPATNQSTYEAYTASDLMVARGTVTRRTDGGDGSALRFTMEHQMALVVVRVPSTEYTYTETIGGNAVAKSYRLYTGLNLGDGGWRENSYTARYLWKPQYEDQILGGSYYNSAGELRKFTVSTNLFANPGKYRLFTIDGGKETVAERPLKEGDYYMRDGSILPGETFASAAALPDGVKADCLGVVFWVGEKEGNHWTLTNRLYYGDHLLMRDHPECTHGMAVALRDASPTAAAWATGEGASEYLYDWADGFGGFTHAEQADWKAIKDSDFGYGYRNSRLMKLYGTRHPATTFPAYGGIDAYAAAHPAPDGSSGWFFPGQRELAMMCYGMADNYLGKPTARRDLLNGLFRKAGGEAFDGVYWSSREDASKAWTLDFADRTTYGNEPKSDTYRVRTVIAF